MVFLSELVKLRDGQLGWSIVIVDQTERDAKPMESFGEVKSNDFEGFGFLEFLYEAPARAAGRPPLELASQCKALG